MAASRCTPKGSEFTMRHPAHNARQLVATVSTPIVALAAIITVNVFMATPAYASAPAAIDDCTLANGLGKWLNFFLNSLVNVGKMGGWILLAIGLLIGFGGAIVSRGHKGWQIASAALGLVIVVFSLAPLLGAAAFTCVPKITIN